MSPARGLVCNGPRRSSFLDLAGTQWHLRYMTFHKKNVFSPSDKGLFAQHMQFIGLCGRANVENKVRSCRPCHPIARSGLVILAVDVSCASAHFPNDSNCDASSSIHLMLEEELLELRLASVDCSKRNGSCSQVSAKFALLTEQADLCGRCHCNTHSSSSRPSPRGTCCVFGTDWKQYVK